MKKTLTALTLCIAAVCLAVNAGPTAPTLESEAAPSVDASAPPPVEWARPQAPFDDREMTPVETAGAARGD